MISAFDIGGSKIASAGVSPDLGLSALSARPTPVDDYPAFLQAVADGVPAGAQAVALSVAGMVDPDAGTVGAANIPCLSGRPLRSDLESLVDKPVFLINDANAFGLCEAHKGAGSGFPSVFAVILGTGIGGAIILKGELLLGAGLRAGEWGHGPAAAMRTGRPLPRWTCGCGQTGCIDLYGGARGLERLHREATGETQSSFAILSAWQAGDAGAGETLDLYLDIVGGALAGVVNILDPAILVAGGGLAGNAALLDALEREMQSRILPSGKAPRLVPAAIEGNGALIGAAVHAKGELAGGRSFLQQSRKIRGTTDSQTQ